jgi:hypothetical protein
MCARLFSDKNTFSAAREQQLSRVGCEELKMQRFQPNLNHWLVEVTS